MTNSINPLLKKVSSFGSKYPGWAAFLGAFCFIVVTYGPAYHLLDNLGQATKYPEVRQDILMIFILPAVSAGVCCSKKICLAAKIPFILFLAIYMIVMLGVTLVCGYPAHCNP
jgi:hypothetical protein